MVLAAAVSDAPDVGSQALQLGQAICAKNCFPKSWIDRHQVPEKSLELGT